MIKYIEKENEDETITNDLNPQRICFLFENTSLKTNRGNVILCNTSNSFPKEYLKNYSYILSKTPLIKLCRNSTCLFSLNFFSTPRETEHSSIHSILIYFSFYQLFFNLQVYDDSNK
jgi:hypothetical protein